jgi:hypothetical protein
MDEDRQKEKGGRKQRAIDRLSKKERIITKEIEQLAIEMT